MSCFKNIEFFLCQMKLTVEWFFVILSLDISDDPEQAPFFWIKGQARLKLLINEMKG